MAMIRKDKRNEKENFHLYLSLAANCVLLVLLFWSSSRSSVSSPQLRSTQLTWHGGHPLAEHSGTCYCNSVTEQYNHIPYCMCTPNLAVDLIVVSDTTASHVWIAKRRDTGQSAVIGGFVKTGESAEAAIVREFKEETGYAITTSQIRLFGSYSDPQRDNRRHTISLVYVIQLEGTEELKASDDVKALQKITFEPSALQSYDFFADHRTILLDYYFSIHENVVAWPQQPFDVVRAVCPSSKSNGILGQI